MYPLPPSRRAFTLVELLVVISIVTLLMAILLPVLRSARSAAQATTSLSNARQIMVALHTYAGDNNNSFPFSRFESYEAGGVHETPSGEPDSVPYWGGVLYDWNYVTDWRVYWSPGRDSWYLQDETHFADPESDRYAYTGYAANQLAMATRLQGVANRAQVPVRPGHPAFPPPSDMIALVEAWDSVTYASIGRDGLYAILPRSNSTHRHKIFTYNDAAVRTYVDGHGSMGAALEIGWNPGTGGRNGEWAYTSIWDYRHVAPWYSRWWEGWE